MHGTANLLLKYDNSQILFMTTSEKIEYKKKRRSKSVGTDKTTYG
jgi:hypothetical protein